MEMAMNVSSLEQGPQEQHGDSTTKQDITNDNLEDTFSVRTDQATIPASNVRQGLSDSTTKQVITNNNLEDTVSVRSDQTVIPALHVRQGITRKFNAFDLKLMKMSQPKEIFIPTFVGPDLGPGAESPCAPFLDGLRAVTVAGLRWLAGRLMSFANAVDAGGQERPVAQFVPPDEDSDLTNQTDNYGGYPVFYV